MLSLISGKFKIQKWCTSGIRRSNLEDLTVRLQSFRYGVTCSQSPCFMGKSTISMAISHSRPINKKHNIKKNVFFLVYSYMIIEILLVSIHSQTIKNTAEKLRPRLRSSRKALGRGPWRFVHFRENQRWGFPSMGDPQNGWFIRDNAFLMGNSHFLQFAIGNGP